LVWQPALEMQKNQKKQHMQKVQIFIFFAFLGVTLGGLGCAGLSWARLVGLAAEMRPEITIGPHLNNAGKATTASISQLIAHQGGLTD